VDFLRWVALEACVALPASMVLGFGDKAITRIIETQTTFVRHTATEYQRKVAEQNARAFFKQLTPAKKAELKKKKIKTVLIPIVRTEDANPYASFKLKSKSLKFETLQIKTNTLALRSAAGSCGYFTSPFTALPREWLVGK
jgi:hypothetical protein